MKGVALAQDFQPAPDQRRADALPLMIRQHSQRRQPHADDPTPRALDERRREEDVPHDDLTLLSHQRQRIGTRNSVSQPIDDVSLRRLPERQLVDDAYFGYVGGLLSSDDNHTPAAQA